jgi:ATP-dependent 26S proteasome regulatory subunit
VRALADFRLDAIYVGKIDALTVRRQIDLQRLFGITRKPLMADVSANTSVAEMRALRDANVVVVVTDGADNVEKLRKTIDELPPRTKRRDDERPTPLVPSAAAAGGHDHDDDD